MIGTAVNRGGPSRQPSIRLLGELKGLEKPAITKTRSRPQLAICQAHSQASAPAPTHRTKHTYIYARFGVFEAFTTFQASYTTPTHSPRTSAARARRLTPPGAFQSNRSSRYANGRHPTTRVASATSAGLCVMPWAMLMRAPTSSKVRRRRRSPRSRLPSSPRSGPRPRGPATYLEKPRPSEYGPRTLRHASARKPAGFNWSRARGGASGGAAPVLQVRH